MQSESLETLLKEDFARLAAALEADGFAERVLKALSARRRFRLVAVGLAGGAGALIASLQFAKLFPNLPAAFGDLPANAAAGGLSPQLLAAAALAVALAATAMVLPSDR
ncbi:MAG: hypothetical protein ACE5FO_03150 [Parvularculaceae bacterium]